MDSDGYSSHRSNLTELGDIAPRASFESAEDASASSTPTDADESYDSVGQDGEEESVPGQINTSGGNNTSPGDQTRGSYYTAQGHNPSVVSETTLGVRSSARSTRGRGANRLDL